MKGPAVWMTVSSLVNYEDPGNPRGKQIILHWRELTVPSFMSLGFQEKIVFTAEIFTVSGSILTNVEYSMTDEIVQNIREQKDIGTMESPYTLINHADTKNAIETKILSSSFKLYPRWMNEFKEVIGDIPLTSLMIPGSHDAGSYQSFEEEERLFTLQAKDIYLHT